MEQCVALTRRAKPEKLDESAKAGSRSVDSFTVRPVKIDRVIVDERALNSMSGSRRERRARRPKTVAESVNFINIKQCASDGHESFRAITRVLRECERKKAAPRVVRTLMDPGAELNLVRSNLLGIHSKERKLLVHAREPCKIILTNNGKEIGRVTEAVYLSFM